MGNFSPERRVRGMMLLPCLAALSVCLLAAPSSPEAGKDAAVVLYVAHPVTVRNAVLFVKSIRAFGGNLKDIPVWVLSDALSEQELEPLYKLSVTVRPMQIDAAHRAFPYSRKVHACATAERLLTGKVKKLLYFDTEMIAFHPFGELLLKEGKSVAMRPVMLLNTVGQAPEAPVDAFWRAVYADVGTAPSDQPAVETFVDEKKCRFYINCEAICVQPEDGLFQEWQRLFVQRLDDEAFLKSACADPLHQIFLHQAVLSALIASRVSSERLQWIPSGVVYPVHLHARMPAAKKLARLDQAAVVGYDLQNSANSEILTMMPVSEPARAWVVDAMVDNLAVQPGVYREEGSCNTGLVKTTGGYLLIDPSNPPRNNSWLAMKFGGQKPAAVFFTHAHWDHWDGLSLWPLAGVSPMVAQRNWVRTVEYLDLLAPFLHRRNELFTAGQWKPNPGLPQVKPDTTFGDVWEKTLSGVDVVMLHAPAETEDAAIVWLPKQKTAFVGDAFSAGFPNLGTPRGCKPRFALDYVRAIDQILALQPECVIPGHGSPVVGSERVRAALTKYRDAVRFVHDATVQGINAGQDAPRLAREIRLPENLALPEAFGKVSWAVRSIYQNYVGWFDGQPQSLLPDAASDVDADLVELAGGADKILERARQLLDSGSLARAIHLSDLVLRLTPEHREMLALRRKAFEIVSGACANWGERNLYNAEIQRIDAILKR